MPCGTADRIRRIVAAASAALSLGLAVTATGCSDKPSAAQCDALLDHVIDLEVKEAGVDKDMPANMKADLDKQRKELKGFVREQFLKQCLDSLPVAFVECGMQAKSKADYAECEKQQ